MQTKSQAEQDRNDAEDIIDNHVTKMVPEKTPILETVILIDENTDIRETTAAILLGAGYEVIAVATPKAAMKAIADEGSANIKLLLTEIAFSGPMNGLEAAQSLKTQYPHIEVLFLSAASDIASLVGNSSVKGAGYLQRPYLRDNLLQSVQSMVTKKVA